MSRSHTERSVIARLVLGAIHGEIIDPQSLGLRGDDFRSELHQDLWAAIEGVAAEGREVDLITVLDWIWRRASPGPSGAAAAAQRLLDMIEGEFDEDTESCAAELVAKRGR